MIEKNYSNGFSGSSVKKYPFFEGPPSETSREAKGLQEDVTQEIAKICCEELVVDQPQNCDDVDPQDHMIRELDDSQPLRVEPPLTLSKICSKLTAVEQLWLARVVKAHGKEVMLARWSAYEVHINYVRYLR
ncbi:MAG: hypothetical protein U0236_16875 [Nitrospira sp.]